MPRYSKRVASAFMDLSAGDYYVDPDGHWLTLKPGFARGVGGGRIIHESTAAAMLAAAAEVVAVPLKWIKPRGLSGLCAVSEKTQNAYHIQLTDGEPPYGLRINSVPYAKGDTVQAMKDAAEIVDAQR